MSTIKRKKPKALSHGRPTIHRKPPSTLSSKATRTLIRTHHTLEKQRAKALAAGDANTATAITQQIAAQGGIERYQQCSLQGQDTKRGGDSSRILMEWLSDLKADLKLRREESKTPIRMLEVGALSVTNACSRSGLFEIERIDLNSQAEGIKEQDFMLRPLPHDLSERFDIISLSLVLNFVPDAVGKGEMLRRTLAFLRPLQEKSEFDEVDDVFPSLFLVVPASCVLNSRYMDEERLEAIMASLGYVQIQRKISNKLVYYLWRANDVDVARKVVPFRKTELKSGGARNNFAIVMK